VAQGLATTLHNPLSKGHAPRENSVSTTRRQSRRRATRFNPKADMIGVIRKKQQLSPY